MRVKREILERLASQFGQEPEGRQSQLGQYRREHPLADDFARFRAVGERQGQFWTEWPQRLRDGRIEPGDYDEAIYRYHLYTQWQLEEQLRAMTDTARASQLLWYLDFPLGVSGVGYDVWRQRDVFALGAAGGAPPDAFFTKGQNWGFPPLDPHKLRQQGYRYLIAALDRHLSYASVLRIDHIMMLHRLYWVPDGLEASDGVYVRYPREELFAVLTLESHQHRAWIIGENLGTVPEILNEAMEEHGVGEMFVVQYELKPDEKQPMRPIPSRCVAAVNTHDMPPFAAFWTGLDIDDRLDLGLLDEDEASVARDEQAVLRRALVAFLSAHGLVPPESLDPEEVLEACLAVLAASPAAMVLVNLEDLWKETLPQNTPGTSKERPNWRRKTRYSFESFRELPGVLRILETVDKSRKKTTEDLLKPEEQDS
jgi:4-alpha-glucanotransferase